MIRADFHCHTRHSPDCFAAVADVLEMAQRRGLTHLAITDHDAIEGAWRARDQTRLEIIVGCELSLTGGAHLIGLFLERMPAARTALEAAAEIHAQGGLVVVPHPFQPVAGAFHAGVDERLLAQLDAVEVCNGYEPAERNRQARDLAEAHRLPMLSGSDAHYLADVGRACVEFPEITGSLTPAAVKQAARRLWVPTQDLSGLHVADAAFRAGTAPRLRRTLPKGFRTLARQANWLRFQRRVQKLCREPVRKEWNS